MKRNTLAIAMLALAVSFTSGCSVNVIVAPHAGLTIDSFKDGGGTQDIITGGDTFSDTYGDDEVYEVMPPAQVL